MKTTTFILLAVFAASAMAADNDRPPNFIVMIGDDMGVETVSCYPVGSKPAKTPNIDELCDTGVRFDNFWAQAVCSPTRATILTGQFGFRNGVGTPATGPTLDLIVPEIPDGASDETVDSNLPGGMGAGMGGGMGMGAGVPEHEEDDPLNQRPSITKDAYGLPAALAADESLNYQSAAFGKWHLASTTNGGINHPAVVGFDHYEGNYNGGAPESFFAWSKVINGEITDGQTGYITTETVNDVLRWYEQRDKDRPWLMWVAFNAPHSPWSAPPAELLSDETAALMDGASEQEAYAAMIEAMDTEIGRLLSEIPEDELSNTYIMFLGDNGTPSQMATPPITSDRAKGRVHQGGILVPLIVSGPRVTQGASTSSLANSVDLFSTILDLAGTGEDDRLNNTVIDGVSLAPVLENPDASVRDFAYADVFGPQQGVIADRHAIRNTQYKLIRDRRTDTLEFYDMSVDPWELNNLLDGELSAEQQQAYDKLTETLDNLQASR